MVTDKDMYGRVQGLNNQLRQGTGEAVDEIGSTFEAMLKDIGRAVQRPFERTR